MQKVSKSNSTNKILELKYIDNHKQVNCLILALHPRCTSINLKIYRTTKIQMHLTAFALK